jgi:hypothetical protein
MRSAKFSVVLLLALVLLSPFACKTTQKKPTLDCSTISATYSKDIAPIVSNNCMPCHKAGSLKGDFSFYDGIKVPAQNGLLEKHVLIQKDMPPKGPLSEDDRKKIRCWLNNGALNN